MNLINENYLQIMRQNCNYLFHKIQNFEKTHLKKTIFESFIRISNDITKYKILKILKCYFIREYVGTCVRLSFF